MGKKSKFKKIRRLASQMPAINHMVKVSEKVDGKFLIDHGVKQVEGKPVVENGAYKAFKKVAVPLNHNRKMKKLYNKYGVRGVNNYLSQVKNYVDQQQSKNAV